MLEQANKPKGRQKKSQEEKVELEMAYIKNSKWDYDLKADLAIKLNMTFA